MISGEDESSPVLNGRLRPRKSTATISNTPNKSTIKPENKLAQDRPKRNSTPSKVSPNKQDDLTAKADSLPLAQLLCPYCDRKFTTKLSASKHARRIHLSTSKQDNFINCLFCKHSEAVSSEIIRHMVDNHPNQYFACLNCNTRFLSTSELAEHKHNACDKQKQAYRSKLRQTTSPVSKKNQKKINLDDKNPYPGECNELKLEPEFNGLVISCELKPSQVHDAADIEDKITTNLIMPSNIGNTVLDKNAVIILDNLQWNRRMPSNFSFRNADADQILSRLGVVHRSPRVGDSTRREWLKMIDDNSQKFEKCFDTNFYSRVASNVQENLARFLDGSFNFSPDPDKVIKTRKSKSSAIINTAEGFPILLPHAQYSRNRFDGYIPRAVAPKHKWKWDSTENEKNIIIDANVIKRDNHVDNCIITLVSSLDIWTQLRMRRKFEGIFCKAPTEKIEKQNIIARELKEILESREIPCSSSRVVEYSSSTLATTATGLVDESSDFPSFLGLSARAIGTDGSMKPAVLSGEWVRPRCYVCCACGDQTRDSRALTMHMAAHHPNAQVQHYEIVGESLLNADILKHLYVPPSQMSNRTRPLRGFRDCTKCKKSVTIEELHQHMLDCAGDTPTVRKKGRPRPFGVRRRRPRLPDNTMRKKMRKDLRTRHNQKGRLRARPRIRTEVGDAETIRKMIADLPAKRHRQASGNATQQVLRPRRKLDKQRSVLKVKHLASKELEKYNRKVQVKNDPNDSIIDEDDQPLKPKSKIEPEKIVPAKKRFSSRVIASKNNKKSSKEVVNEPEAPIDNANSSQSQQMSSDISTQGIKISASGNDNRGDGENCDGAGNNDDDDKHKGSAPDPTLLKHSIINITSSPANIALQLQQQDLSSKLNNTVKTACDTSTVFLEKEDKCSIPDKPPLPTNQKSSSEKKRRSLLSCIEKIKNQQKGETMIDGRMMMGRDQRAIERAQLSLMDPNPAVICATRDEFGAATNVVPSNINGPQVYMANELYQKDPRYRQSSEKVDPFYSQRNTSASEFASPKAKIPSGHRRKSFATRLSQSHNDYDHDSQFQMTQIIQQQQWHLLNSRNLDAYINMMPLSLQQQVLSAPHRTMLPENILQQHEASGALFQFQSQRFPLPSQYHVPRLNDNVAPQINTKIQQNSNISSLSPQSWNRDSTQIQQVYNNHAVSNMLPSMTATELLIPNTRQKSQKRISESSETDMYAVSRSLEEANLLNHVNLQRSPFKSNDYMYVTPTSQEHKDSSHYYNTAKRSRAPIMNKDGHGIYDNNGASKSSKQYQTIQSHITNVIHQNYVSPNAEEEHHSVPRTEKSVYDSYHESHKNVVPKSLYSSKLNKKKIKDRYLAEHPHLSPSVPTETQAAKIIHLPNMPSIHKSVGMYTRDQNDDENCNVSAGAFENQIDSGSTEEPLDLSGKNVHTGFNKITLTPHYNLRMEESETYLNDNITSNTYTDEQHVQQSCTSDQNNSNENIKYLTDKTSKYYTEQKEKTVSDQITCHGQSSTYEDDFDTIKYHRSSIESRELVQVLQSKLDSHGSEVSVPTTSVVDTIDQLDIMNENVLPAQEKQIVNPLETIDATTHVQNHTFETNNEKTCSALDTTLNHGNNTNTKSRSLDQDPETAKKIALFPKELVDLLDEVPKERQTRFVTVISQLIPAANQEIVKPVITEQKDRNTRQQVEKPLPKGNTLPICDPSTNHSENRLTINTVVLPSSSILPKKRHSPSTRVNSQEVYSNLSLTKQSSTPTLQSSSTITNFPGDDAKKSKNTSDENTTDSLMKMQLSEINEREASSSIEKIIDLTHDNLNSSNIKPDTSNSNLLQSRNCSEKTASLRAVRIKTPLSRKSISDDKQPMVTKECNNQQSTCHNLRQSYLNTTQMSHSEYGNKNIDTAAQNKYHHEDTTKEIEKRDTIEQLIESEKSFLKSVSACELLEQSEVEAVTSDVAPFNNIMKQVPALNQIEEKNETISQNKEHTFDARKDYFSDLTIQIEIKDQGILESSKSTSHTADSTADSTINDEESVENSTPVNSKLNDKIESSNKIKEDHEMVEVDHKVDRTTESCDLKEQDETLVPQNILLETTERTLSSNMSNDENVKGDTVDLINTMEHIECATDLLNLDIETIVQNVDSKDVQAVNNDSQSRISRKLSPTKSFERANESFSLVDNKSKSTSEILETSIELIASSNDTDIATAIKQPEINLKNPETYESALLSDSELAPKETSKPALRRSKRGKSMFLDDTYFDNDSINKIENGSVQKKPATKKHLIFSKMLDEREQITNLIPSTTKGDNDVAFDTATETKICGSFKRKIIGKTKNIKKNLKQKNACLDLDNVNNSSDNNNRNIIEKESECIMTSNNHSSDLKAIRNEKIIQNDEDDRIIKNASTQKRKLNALLFNNTNDNCRAKRVNNYSNIEKNVCTEESKPLKTIVSDNKIDVTSTYGAINNDTKKHQHKTSTCGELRTACYNRPTVHKQTFSNSVSDLNSKNYDPYDIDLDIDIVKTAPIVKRKGNKSVSTNNASKLFKKYPSHEEPVDKVRHESAIEKLALAISDISPHNNSDSDSSISDTPLQKYVEKKEKALKEGPKSSDCNKPEPSSKSVHVTKGHIDMSESASQSLNKNVINNDDQACDTVEDTAVSISSTDNIKSNKPGAKDVTSDKNVDVIAKTTVELHQGVDQIENIIETSKGKSNTKQKKDRRSVTSASLNISAETDQQLESDNFLATFGFYSIKTPRKSNLLASKKISETFHKIESDDADLRMNRPRKSSHSEHKKATDDSTSKVTQDVTNAKSDRLGSTLQSVSPPVAGEIVTVSEQNQACDDGEVDLITAQKMLESEEIRKLERDLYSGFKEAAEANAGKTSGFNHLRVEEPHLNKNSNQDAITPTLNDDKTNPIISLRRFESPQRCESPEMPESPESLKDKPLMYPEEEVNIYEDKYDIIKRRREASANAKQAQKLDKPKKSKNEKSKKKPEKKNTKKCAKKSYGSHVPTKGALKGFDGIGIKISIPTQDLNMPLNVSPPHNQQRLNISKKQIECLQNARTDSVSSDSDPYSKDTSIQDVYEFQDDERPVTKGFRLIRGIDKTISISSKNEEKIEKLNQIISDKKLAIHYEDDNGRATDQEKERAKISKFKGKGKGKSKRNYVEDNGNAKTETPNQEGKRCKKEKLLREETESDLVKFTYAAKTELNTNLDSREELVKTIIENRIYNDHKNTLGTLQDNEEPYDDSDIEENPIMPGTSGFVPDRNDESSYESDSSSRTPLSSVLKGPYACTCLSEIDSDDSETERGCAHSSCRYSHLNAAKNAVMGKIFKNNAVRCDKSDDSTNEPKPDLDQLFDSLLETNTNNNVTATRNISPVPGPSSAPTYYSANDEKYRNRTNQVNKKIQERDVSNADDGFSSPNNRDSVKVTKKSFERSSKSTQNRSNSSIMDDGSTSYNLSEKTEEPSDNKQYIMMSKKHIQTEESAQLLTSAISSRPVEQEVPEIPTPPNTNSKKNDKTSDSILDKLDKDSESSDYITLKNIYGEVNETRGTQTKRSVPQTDAGTSSSVDDLNAAKLARKYRKANKKHKSHHKNTKLCDDDKLGESHGNTTALKQNSRIQNDVEEKVTEDKQSKVKRSLSRKSDEGISTSHDNSADAYDTGVAVQRARRKCTVGKQNVLAEHWSSSESEADSPPSRVRGRKNSINKRSSRIGKMNRASGRSRGRESDGSEPEAAGPRAPPPPQVRARAAEARDTDESDSDRDYGSDSERYTNDQKDLEMHGWIVGDSHKKLVMRLACNKSKRRRLQERRREEMEEYEEDEEVEEETE